MFVTMRFITTLLLISIFSLSATAQTAAPFDTFATHYLLPGADCASFPAAAKPQSYHQESLRDTRRFTPRKKQLVRTEKALAKVDLGRVNSQPLNSYYAEYPSIIKAQLPKYKRQYYGFYNAEGHRCFFINCFIYNVEDSPGQVPRWLKELQWFYDGGPALWSVFYDLKTHKFYDFHHNSEG